MKRDASNNRIDGKYYHALHTWSILINLASIQNGHTTYGEIHREICTGKFPGNAGLYLDVVAAYCEKNGLPPLTVLVRDKQTHKPSDKFKEQWLHDGETLKEAEGRVRACAWSRHGPSLEDFEAAYTEWEAMWKKAVSGIAVSPHN